MQTDCQHFAMNLNQTQLDVFWLYYFTLGDKSLVYYASRHPTRPYITRSEK